MNLCDVMLLVIQNTFQACLFFVHVNCLWILSVIFFVLGNNVNDLVVYFCLPCRSSDFSTSPVEAAVVMRSPCPVSFCGLPSSVPSIAIMTYEPDFSKAIASVIWSRHRRQTSCMVFNCNVTNCPLCPSTSSKSPEDNDKRRVSTCQRNRRRSKVKSVGKSLGTKPSTVNWLLDDGASREATCQHLKRRFEEVSDSIANSSTISSSVYPGSILHPLTTCAPVDFVSSFSRGRFSLPCQAAFNFNCYHQNSRALGFDSMYQQPSKRPRFDVMIWHYPSRFGLCYKLIHNRILVTT